MFLYHIKEIKYWTNNLYYGIIFTKGDDNMKIEINDLTVDYAEKNKRFTALKNVSFGINEGEFVSIVGSSGCGKSTLLSVLEGIYKAASGTVNIDGKPVEGTGTDRGVVFQHYSLFPWMNTRSNIAFGIRQVRKDLSKKERLALADEYLKKVGLEGYGNKYPSQLSGGMQQRAAIARALAMDTDILLMDEPFSAVDPKNRTELQELLLHLWEGEEKNGKKKTVVFVTHDIDEAILLSDRIVVMAHHPGTVADILKVPFERSHRRAAMREDRAYTKFRDSIMSIFWGNVYNGIGEEVVI